MEKAVDIGKLNKRITIQKRLDSTDAIGQTVTGWSDLKTVWADFYPMRSGEYQEAERKMQEEVVYKCKIRYIDGVDSSCRICHRGRLFSIDRVINPNEECYKLDIECTEYIEKGVEI